MFRLYHHQQWKYDAVLSSNSDQFQEIMHNTFLEWKSL